MTKLHQAFKKQLTNENPYVGLEFVEISPYVEYLLSFSKIEVNQYYSESLARGYSQNTPPPCEIFFWKYPPVR